MTSTRKLINSVLLLVFCSLVAIAQTPAADTKQFTKDGLTFSYPSGWILEDVSNADAQQFNMGRADSEAQIRLFVFRTQVSSPERLTEARKVLVDPYVASTFRQFEQMGAKPQRAPATIDIGALKSEGVKISATLDGEPGAAEIHWGVIGQRLVVLTMFGPDKALKKAAPAWDMVRSSIVVEAPKPATPKPSPSPTPTASPK